jgi:hypothetical protein
VDYWESELPRRQEELVAGRADESFVEGARRGLEAEKRKRDLARVEYAAQIHLLELELKDAESAFAAAEGEQKMAEALFRSATLPRSKFTEAERTLEMAKLRIERAKTLLELYLKADPKNPAAGEKPPQPPGAET